MDHPSEPSTPSWMTRRPTRRVTRSSVLMGGVLATAAATLTASLGLGFSTVQADPGDTFVPIGSSQLIHSDDLASIRFRLDTANIELNRDEDFSACLGAGNPWTGVLPGSPKPIKATWTSRRHRDRALYESIAQAKTPRQAKRYTTTLVDEAVRACQGEPDRYDFRYGPTTTSRVGSGRATWALSYRGDNTRPDGGVVVFRKGANFGFIQVAGTRRSTAQTMESVAKSAVHRLVYSK